LNNNFLSGEIAMYIGISCEGLDQR
jgi:hypothetical protein